MTPRKAPELPERGGGPIGGVHVHHAPPPSKSGASRVVSPTQTASVWGDHTTLGPEAGIHEHDSDSRRGAERDPRPTPVLRGTSPSSVYRFLRAGGRLPAPVVPSPCHPVGPRRSLTTGKGAAKRPRPKKMTKKERQRREREWIAAYRARRLAYHAATQDRTSNQPTSRPDREERQPC